MVTTIKTKIKAKKSSIKQQLKEPQAQYDLISILKVQVGNWRGVAEKERGEGENSPGREGDQQGERVGVLYWRDSAPLQQQHEKEEEVQF